MLKKYLWRGSHWKRKNGAILHRNIKSDQKNDRENIHQHKTHKKKLEKFAVAEFDDMNQIEWVPFDPYGD